MSIWEGVRPGTHQNTIMDFFEKNVDVATGEIAELLYQEDTPANRNRATSLLWSLEQKGLVRCVGSLQWELASKPCDLSPEALARRITALEEIVRELKHHLIL